jgi:hypothetical protein
MWSKSSQIFAFPSDACGHLVLYNLHVLSILTCCTSSTWDIDPPCPKVASTITLLLKQWHPGSAYIRASQETTEVHPGQSVLHFHEYHSDKRAIIMDEFLVRKYIQECGL